MAKKAVYDPGELGRVREKLGTLDEQEAKRMAKILGGEVGTEKTPDPLATVSPHPKRAAPPNTNTSTSQSGQRVQQVSTPKAANSILIKKPSKKKPIGAGDDPAVPIKVRYSERFRMDRYAAQAQFDIKSPSQVLIALFSFFKEPPDLVSRVFVSKRLNEYYKQIELLVVSTRTMFPRNNLRRNEQLKKTSPFVCSVLDTIRSWNIERITSVMARLQSRPRNVSTNDCADILRDIYRPLFILEKLTVDFHIKEAYKLLYKFLYIDNPMEAKEKYQHLIHSALDAFVVIRKDIQYLLYPLFLKLVSDTWIPYDQFFSARKKRIMAFLNVTEEDRISPNQLQAEEKGAENKPEAQAGEATKNFLDADDAEVIARQAADEAERKALDRGLRILESLFPKAGWDNLSSYPDLYAYFAKIFDLKGYELISPRDPILQVAILIRILEELFFGLRYVSFKTILGPGESSEPIGQIMTDILEHWRDFEITFSKEYLTRLQEYCRLLDTSVESRTSPYAKRIYTELQWIKRICFLPYYKFETLSSTPFKKGSMVPVYPEVRKLRKYLTMIATKIEESSKRGGAEGGAPCEGIENPWTSYVFQVSNPLSMRLNMLLGSKKRNNASLIYYTLAIATVLDHLVNNYNSWAYQVQEEEEPLFRSINGEGNVPQFGVDEKIDANALFKQVMQEKRAAKAAKKQ
ncbi:MAG: hypothetical protein LBQ30_11110 [Treponema sp.]|jgi:hypothetical protein|nr:hypothetical protein [Treponema sp.]